MITEQHSIAQDFENFGQRYMAELARLEHENEELRAHIEDLIAYRETCEQESFDSDFVRSLILKQQSPLKLWREQRGLTQKELSQRSQVSQGIISEIESGKRRGSIDNFKSFADVLDCDVDDLI